MPAEMLGTRAPITQISDHLYAKIDTRISSIPFCIFFLNYELQKYFYFFFSLSLPPSTYYRYNLIPPTFRFHLELQQVSKIGEMIRRISNYASNLNSNQIFYRICFKHLDE